MGVQTPSIEKGVHFYCLVIELKQWLIIKIVTTRCRILRLNAPNFDFGWGSAPDPTEGANSAPPVPLAGFKGSYTSKGREGSGREKGRGKGEGGLEPPPLQISGYATALYTSLPLATPLEPTPHTLSVLRILCILCNFHCFQ